ncbi:MAG: hypothetical protein Q7U39_07810 [Nitrospira sp.]|nr:hypothetical protein [Nitrospira sp.]
MRLVADEGVDRAIVERLHAALTHLDHHVKPAIKEWDRIVDRLPEE